MPLPRRRTRGRVHRSTDRTVDRTAVRVRYDTVAGSTVIHVQGDVDLSTTDTVREVLTEAVAATSTGGVVVVELAHVGFFGSAGLHVLADLHEQCRSSGDPLFLACVPPIAEWMLKTVGSKIPQFSDVDAALRAAMRAREPT